MKLGVVARCDGGGLASQTWEAWRHLQPERTLVLDLPSTRGKGHRERYPGAVFLDHYPTLGETRDFLDGLDVVFGAECWYCADWTSIAAECGVVCVQQANPELYDPAEAAGSRIVLPTGWEACRVPHEAILPVPVPTDRFTPKLRAEARRFYHVSSNAMADRNGTATLIAALRQVRSHITVTIRSARSRGDILAHPLRVPTNVELVELSHSEQPYYACWPDADVLLLPRRYGGLCLPAQEAAALGMPVVMTDLPPQRDWPHVELAPVMGSEPIVAKGGTFDAWTAEPGALARIIDRLASDPERVRDLSARALEWANERSWFSLLPTYRETLTP